MRIFSLHRAADRLGRTEDFLHGTGESLGAVLVADGARNLDDVVLGAVAGVRDTLHLFAVLERFLERFND